MRDLRDKTVRKRTPPTSETQRQITDEIAVLGKTTLSIDTRASSAAVSSSTLRIVMAAILLRCSAAAMRRVGQQTPIGSMPICDC